jgi:hypothetical protein
MKWLLFPHGGSSLLLEDSPLEAPQSAPRCWNRIGWGRPAADATTVHACADTLLSLHHLASELVPRIEASNAGRLGHLSCDLKNVAKRVAVKPAHGGEVCGKAFGVSCLKLLDQQLHVGGNDFFGGLRPGCRGKYDDIVLWWCCCSWWASPF